MNFVNGTTLVFFPTSCSKAKMSKSDVWKYFDKSEEGTFTICRLCKTKIKYKGSSTSAMNNHLKNKHKSLTLPQTKQSRLVDYHKSIKKMTKAGFDEVTRGFVICASLDLRPISMIEDKGFRYCKLV